MGLKPIITDDRADFTCWFVSETSSFTYGNIDAIIIWDWLALSNNEQNSLTFVAATPRTSASASFKRY